MWLCDGNSGAVGDDPGLSECKECIEGLPSEKCGCMVDAVGDVTRMLGLSAPSSKSGGN